VICINRRFIMKDGLYAVKCFSRVLVLCLLLLAVVSETAQASPAPSLTIALPEYRKPVLLPVSQTNAWSNVVPNALADYYTYIPYTTADAVKLGFPSSCGNLAKGDVASTEDCYTISAKKFQQGFSLPAAWGFGGQGLLDETGTPFGSTTWVYGYGSGGANWILPYYDTTKPGVIANTPVTGNAPAPFANGAITSAGIWHFPAPTIKGTRGRPVRVQWLNDLPNEKPTGFDPTVCEGVPADCFPYNRIVTHVHGAHTGPESDGLALGWFTPGFAEIGLYWESTSQHGPEGTYYYPMDQEASTIWYHDHAVGTTHNNTNMGMAGFFPITDSNEKSLQSTGKLPTGAQELGFALQDRIFYKDGQMAMPDAPILDANYPLIANCTYTTNPVTGDITPNIPGNCSPLFMKASDGHLVPHNGSEAQAYLGTSATLEFFGNIPVVNGVTYGKYSVDKGVYRMRFIGGSDSRAWALRLKIANSSPDKYLPFWVIGTEQGLLNNPVKSEQLVIMPGERYDVLVDFKSAETLLADGITSGGAVNLANKRIIIENWAGDAPYGGETILPVNDPAAAAFRSVDIPEVMVFDVSDSSATQNISAPSSSLALRPTTIQPLTATLTRNVSLVEIVDNFGRIMPTLDGRGFMNSPATELPRLGATEQWDIINTTVDAHPMHLHQVAFQLVNREAIQILGTDPATQEAILNVQMASTVPPYTPASYVGTGVLEVPGDYEAGWKDTVMCPPGKVTRVKATFDIPGVYVWHCHILSHEEHDMMRPMVVTTPAASVTLTTSGLSQPTGDVTPVTLTAKAFTSDSNYPVGSGFEYDFVVTKNGTPIANQPTRTEPMLNSSLGDSYNMVQTANWQPPNVAGTYVITATAKAMGVVHPINNPLKTTTVNYTVTAPAAVSASSTAAAGTYRSGQSVNITLNFSQPVSSPAGLDIILSSGAHVLTGALTNVSSFSGSYLVAAGQNTQVLNVTSLSGTITDVTGSNPVVDPVVAADKNISAFKVIAIDTSVPISSALPTGGNFSGSVTVSLATEVGASMYYTVNGQIPTTASTLYSVPLVLTAATTTTYTVQYFAVDRAGNNGTVNSASYTIHVSDLTNASVLINGGAAYTNLLNVSLALTATDPSGITKMQVACDGVTFTSEEPFTVTRACTVPAGDGLKTVAIKYIDSLGTIYDPVVAQITVDTVVPVTLVSPGSGVYGGAVSVALTSSKPSDIFYTIDGTEPTTASMKYSVPIVMSSTVTKAFTVKYFAVDRAGNIENIRTGSYDIHIADLTLGVVSINGGALSTNSTNVTLALAAADPNGVPHMQVSCDGITFAAPEAFAATRSCTLPVGDGLKTVQVKFIDGLGTVYPSIPAQITLDTVAATTAVTPISGTYSGLVTVTLSANEAAKIYVTIDGTEPAAVAAQLYSGPFDLAPAVTTTYTVKYFAVDQAGNSGAVSSISYTVHISDMVGSIAVNNGAPYTATAVVTLSLSATDPAGVTTMQLSNDGVNFTVPEPYATSKAWLLTPGDGLKTVYVRYIDGTGSIYTFAADIQLASAAAVKPVGDMNGDGVVDFKDALKAMLAAVGMTTATLAEQVRADVAPLVNGVPVPDGAITLVDVLLILRRSIGLVTW
jgi:FtsP/CotA-like multicopper oxidase with cupredoxin domain